MIFRRLNRLAGRNFATKPGSLDSHRISVRAVLEDKAGTLSNLLDFFSHRHINLTRVESRTLKDFSKYSVVIDFEGDVTNLKTKTFLADLKAQYGTSISTQDPILVPWFPVHPSDLDIVANRTLDAGIDLVSDHPGFNDKEYRSRRGVLAKVALDYRSGQTIPRIQYTNSELKVWETVYDKLSDLHKKYACKEYLDVFSSLEKHVGYRSSSIPQLADINSYLSSTTGFSLRPVSGLLSSRDFLNGLAHRIFFSTQYIRHESRPYYTPEPDIIHELIGHVPLFGQADFADFSQEIGLASCGCSDEDIVRLARNYWFTVEFGLMQQQSGGGDNNRKAYGAGLLSSFGELEYSCNQDKSEFRPFDPIVAGSTEFPITSYQPIYYVASSLSSAKEQLSAYAMNLPKPFQARYDNKKKEVWVDRSIQRKLA